MEAQTPFSCMETDIKMLPKLSTIVLLSMTYARFASAHLRPGLPRFLSLLPIICLLPFLPFSFNTIHFRGISAFFLAWLCLFKLSLLSINRGPLHPTLPLFSFISLACLPVKLRPQSSQTQPSPFPSKLLLSSSIRAALLPLLFSIYQFKNQLNRYLLLTVYCVHIYLFLELILSASSIISRLLGLKIEPQFNKPYFATSLRDFWGRRWNLMVSAILRPSVYDPVRSRLGPFAGVIAAFIVSGVMHEVMFYYNNLRKPTGEVTAFFLLHGGCVVAEWWWVKHERWWRPAAAVGNVLTLGFVAGTAFWLFFPPLVRGGTDEKVIAEFAAMMEFCTQIGQALFGSRQ